MPVTRKKNRRWLLWPAVLLVGLVLGVVLAGLRCRPSGAQLASLENPRTAAQVEEVIRRSQLNTLSADFEVVQSESLQQARPILPDGHLTYLRRSYGNVAIGFDLSSARACERPSVLSPGGRDLFIWLPEPVVSPVVTDYRRSEIEATHNFWTSRPTDNTLVMANGSRVALPGIVARQAELCGLVGRAREEARAALERFGTSLGFERVVVGFGGRPPDREVMGPSGTIQEEVTQMRISVPRVVRLAALVLLGTTAAVVVFPRLASNRQELSDPARQEPDGTSGQITLAEASVLLSRLRAMSSFNCATYQGMVFLRDSLPQKVLGITVGHTRLWGSFPGYVHWAIDLDQLGPDDVVLTTTSGAAHIEVTLPQPEITGVEIDERRVISGRNSSVGLLEDSEEIARCEEALYATAQDELRMQAREAGFQIQAGSLARDGVADLVSEMLGDPTAEIAVRFRQAAPEPQDLPDLSPGDLTTSVQWR